METDRLKKAAQWFYETVFRDEAIQPRQPAAQMYVPTLIRTARSLETGMSSQWQSREAVFLKQARLLAGFEDDYPFDTNVVRYYPTYQSLTDQELRGYFTWRTRLRQGQVEKTSLSFAFLYIYELINQIGGNDPAEGFEKLRTFRRHYGALDPSINAYLDRWLADYIVYYGLDAALLADSPQVRFDQSLAVLENIYQEPFQAVVSAAKELAPKWVSRSKFYAQYPQDFDRILYRTLLALSRHYDARCKKGLVAQYFGSFGLFPVQLFETAVFCDPLKIRNLEYALDPRCTYRCANGHWTVQKYACPPQPNRKLEDLLRAVDSIMRQEYGYRHPVKCPVETKWILAQIRQEVQALLAEKAAAKARAVTIDYSQLDQIRRDAAITQDKLTVEEEWEEDEPFSQAPPAQPQSSADPQECPLSSPEYRLMQCLLYDRPTGWIQQEGHLLSVLVDSINDKLYDTFLDSVLEDTPALIEDYIDDLKEMIHP